MQKFIEQVDPVFKMLNIVPDYKNFFKALQQMIEILSSEAGEEQLLQCIMEYIFYSLDKDGNGLIDAEEMQDVIRETLCLVDPVLSINEEVVLAATEHVLKAADANSDGVISRDEFMAHFAFAQK